MSGGRELTPHEVLVDLLGGADFDHEILDPEAAARLIIEHLEDSGFRIVPARPEGEKQLAADLNRSANELIRLLRGGEA